MVRGKEGRVGEREGGREIFLSISQCHEDHNWDLYKP